MSNCNCYFFCYVLLFPYLGTHVYSWTERPSTPKCDRALTIELELTLEPEQPLKNVKVKSEREPIPVENLSCRTAMLSFFDEFTPVWLWCCLYVSYVIRSQAYAWTEGLLLDRTCMQSRKCGQTLQWMKSGPKIFQLPTPVC